MAAAGRSVRTTCPYCGVGCGVIADFGADGSVSIRGDEDHPANFGRLCSKGSALAETIGPEDRLTRPVWRGSPVDWDIALQGVADRFRHVIDEHGPDAVAFYVSGQLLTEDYYVANKLMKGYIGSANIDTNSRLCMASSVAGHKRAFGTDTVPGLYEDLERADLVVLVGSNLAWCHPVLHQRLEAARQLRPKMKVVAVDPRRTVTCEMADMHLPVASNADVALFSGLLNHLVRSGAVDQAFIERSVSGAEETFARVADWDISRVAVRTGIPKADILEFYRLFTETDRVVTVYSQGVNQSVAGTDKVNAIINCHLATGRIGRPGSGPFSVTGQPNAMGGREVGGLANQLAAHMELANPEHRQLVQDFWGSPVIADRQGAKAVDMFEAVREGRIKAIWIMATNPVDSLPDADNVRAALESCPFVVVSDITPRSDTAQLADVLLPATGWGEKDGTVTNSERRISRQRGFLAAPGEARDDWRIICDVAARMGFAGAFDYHSAAEIFREHAALSAYGNDGSRDFDIGALQDIGEASYDALEPVLWPQPTGGVVPATRFFADGRFYTDDGRARMLPVADTPTIKGSGLLLNTGRIRDQWHTMTRTGRSPRLSAHLAEPFIEISPRDAEDAGIRDASLVVVENAQARVILRALVTARVTPGTLFAPMHWNDQFASAARIGSLIPPAVDPVSGQPGLKWSDVTIRPAGMTWHGYALSLTRPRKIEAEYWALGQTASGGWFLEMAGTGKADDLDRIAAGPWRGALERTGGEKDWQEVSLTDRAGGGYRIAAFSGNRLAGAIFISSDPVELSRHWLRDCLGRRYDEPAARLALLAGRPPQDQADPGATICSCFGVGANEIIDSVVNGGCRSVADVGRCLKAGTNCGSCKGEIARLVSENDVDEAV